MSFDQRILVIGPGKSGTTGLFAAVKAGAEKHAGVEIRECFEPPYAWRLKESLARPFVAKVLLERLYAEEAAYVPLLDEFEKVVLIVRDPRDSLISRLVWQLGSLPAFEHDAAKRDAALALIRQKEKDPASIGVVQLYEQLGALGGRTQWLEVGLRQSFRPVHFLNRICPRAHRITYEAFVARDFADLDAYLGFAAERAAELPWQGTMTLRTGAAGSWRRWFTREDHDAIVVANARRFRALGYPDLDYSPLAGEIPPEEASLYIEQLAQWRRNKVKRKLYHSVRDTLLGRGDATLRERLRRFWPGKPAED